MENNANSLLEPYMYEGIYTCFHLIYYRTVSIFVRAKLWKSYGCPCTLLQWLYLPDKWVLRVWGWKEGEKDGIFSLTTNNQMYFCRVFAQIPVKGKSILLKCTYAQGEYNTHAQIYSISHEVWIFDRKFKRQNSVFFLEHFRIWERHAYISELR